MTFTGPKLKVCARKKMDLKVIIGHYSTVERSCRPRSTGYANLTFHTSNTKPTMCMYRESVAIKSTEQSAKLGRIRISKESAHIFSGPFMYLRRITISMKSLRYLRGLATYWHMTLYIQPMHTPLPSLRALDLFALIRNSSYKEWHGLTFNRSF